MRCFPGVLAVLLLGCRGEPVDDAAPADAGAEAATDSALADTAPSPSDTASADVAPDSLGDVATGDCGSYRAGTTKLVRLDSHCIDETEVTNGQWKTFAAAPEAERVMSTPAHCSWNTTAPSVNPDPTTDGYPRGNVNFCDAKAYCAWAGKRLCGKIGGGPNAKFDYLDAGKSQWFRACAGAGGNKYPYGNAYEGSRCATGSIPLAKARSFAECRGDSAPYSAIFDLSGNVAEWEDSCDTPAPDENTLCRGRGGGTGDHGEASCDRAAEASAKARFAGLGFRCCKD